MNGARQAPEVSTAADEEDLGVFVRPVQESFGALGESANGRIAARVVGRPLRRTC